MRKRIDHKRYVVIASEPGFVGVAADVERALAVPGVSGRITERFPWGLVVNASFAFEELVRRRFPSLAISEEVCLELT